MGRDGGGKLGFLSFSVGGTDSRVRVTANPYPCHDHLQHAPKSYQTVALTVYEVVALEAERPEFPSWGLPDILSFNSHDLLI